MKKAIAVALLCVGVSADQSRTTPMRISTGPIYTMTTEGRIFVNGTELKTQAQMQHALNRLIVAMAKYPMCGGSYPAGHKPEPMDIHWQIEDSE